MPELRPGKFTNETRDVGTRMALNRQLHQNVAEKENKDAGEMIFSQLVLVYLGSRSNPAELLRASPGRTTTITSWKTIVFAMAKGAMIHGTLGTHPGATSRREMPPMVRSWKRGLAEHGGVAQDC
ncbi:g-protein alpha-subunit [Moniliophthora roreri]|nr:g-protein alpha-subunit [Moniliophthora roreri]